MPSAQRCLGRSVLQGAAPIAHFLRPITISAFWSILDSTVWGSGFVYIAVGLYDLEIKLV